MGDSTPQSASDQSAPDSTSSQTTEAAGSSNSTPSAEEVAGVIAELEQYRARLVEDFTATAKKAKLPKSMAMSQLKAHPEISKIDAALAQLRGEAPATEATAES